MLKIYLFIRMPLVMGTLWLLYNRKIIINRLLLLVTEKLFILLGERYPKLAFLKGLARSPIRLNHL